MSSTTTTLTSAIILAAGLATRFDEMIPKQFQNVSGKLLLEWSVDTFLAHKCISDVYVVVHPKHSLYTNALQSKYSGITFLEGGQTRAESTWNALKLIKKASTPPHSVLIHDAARPLISVSVIDRVIAALSDAKAVVPVIPIVDTIRECRPNNTGIALNREILRATQTPQAIVFEYLYNGYAAFFDRNPPLQRPALLTDDASALENFGIYPKMVTGCPRNIKVTTKEDLDYVRFILRSRYPQR